MSVTDTAAPTAAPAAAATPAPSSSGEVSIEDVAATLLQRPEPPKGKAQPKAEPAPATTAATEDDDSDEEATSQLETALQDSESSPDDLTDEDIEAAAGDEEDDNVDIDDAEVDVVVDGTAKKVTLRELKANYSAEGAIERRIQEATQARDVVFQQGHALHNALTAVADRLQRLDAIVAEDAPPNIDWEKLRATDPAKYLLERERFREVSEKRAIIAAEKQKLEQQQSWLQQQQTEHIRRTETAQLLSKMPELADPAKGKAIVDNMMRSATDYYGFKPEEVSGVLDHRQLMVLRDAIKYRELLARKSAGQQKTTPEAVKPLLRPAASNATKKASDVQAKAREKLLIKARKSGKVEDVAALLIAQKR